MSSCDVPRVFHLVGSRGDNELLDGLSTNMYGPGCFNIVSTFAGYRHFIGRVHPDGTWSFPKDFSKEEMDRAKRDQVSFGEGLQKIKDLKPTVVLPQMFCLAGLTSYRALFETMDIPLVGNSAYNLALTTNKAHAKAVVAAAGVPVPESELLRPGDQPHMRPPFMLKPCKSDNSTGVALFTGKDGQDLDKALQLAFEHDDEVLCERFIPLGIELRVAVLEKECGTIEMLPCIEYFLTEDTPIRTTADKLNTSDGNASVQFASATVGRERQCPADVDATLKGKLEALAVKSHKALGCKYYSLYDVRVDPDGEPFFLEACNYCSFHERSPVILMAVAGGYTLKGVFESIVKKAIESKGKPSS